jgi:hypothetical protein
VGLRRDHTRQAPEMGKHGRHKARVALLALSRLFLGLGSWLTTASGVIDVVYYINQRRERRSVFCIVDNIKVMTTVLNYGWYSLDFV